jgi:hypothetical protein
MSLLSYENRQLRQLLGRSFGVDVNTLYCFECPTPSHFAILAGCGILLPTSFQPSQGGDMVCARGPLDTHVAIFHNVGDGEGLLRVFEAVPPFYRR